MFATFNGLGVLIILGVLLLAFFVQWAYRRTRPCQREQLDEWALVRSVRESFDGLPYRRPRGGA